MASDMLDLVIASIPIGLFLIAFVQTLKFLGVSGDKELRLGLVSGAVGFGLLYLLQTLVPAAAPYVEAVFAVIYAVMVAVLAYAYLVRPLGHYLDQEVTVQDIENAES